MAHPSGRSVGRRSSPLATLKVAAALAATGAVVAGTGAAVRIAAEHHVISVPSGVPFIAPAVPRVEGPSSHAGDNQGKKTVKPVQQHHADNTGQHSGGKGDAEKGGDHHPSASPTPSREGGANHATLTPGPSHS
jgi:hypothetical protein